MMGGGAWAVSFFRNLYYDGVVVFLVFSTAFLSWLLHCYAMGGWSSLFLYHW